MISNINQGFLNRVYAFDDYTINELLCKFYQKLEEVINQSNEAYSIVDWIKEEGLEKEVVDQLELCLTDGTLENLLNTEKYNSLKEEMLSEISNYKNEINNSFNTFKNEINSEVNSFKTETNNTINELTRTVNKSINNQNTSLNNSINDINTTVNDFKTEVNDNLNNFKAQVKEDINNMKTELNYVSTYEQLVAAVNKSHTVGQTIYVLPGTYTLTDILFLGNNTKLIGIGEVIFTSSTLNIMVSNYCVNGTGYEGTQNIEVNNITFNGNNRTDGFTLVGFGHCKNVKITNCKFLNLHQWHMIELNSTSNSIIDQCEFDNYGTSGSLGTEAIQLDLAKDSSTFPWFGNYDNTNCNNIIIDKCRFTNVGDSCGCIGNHSYTANYPVKNVTIQNCFASNIGDFCRLRDFNNLVIDNNKVSNAKNFYVGYSVSTVCNGLKLINNDFSGLFTGNIDDSVSDDRFLAVNVTGLSENSLHFQNVRIINNKISNCKGHGIGACIDDCIIANNTFNNILRHGLYYHGGADWIIQNNIFSQTGMEGASRYAIFINSGGDAIFKGVIANNVIYNRNAISINKGAYEISKLIVCNNVGEVTNNTSESSISISNNI